MNIMSTIYLESYGILHNILLLCSVRILWMAVLLLIRFGLLLPAKNGEALGLSHESPINDSDSISEWLELSIFIYF